MEGLKLLIFGDQLENINSMGALLRNIDGLDILVAMTEEEAVKLYLSHDISIVLMDRQLTGSPVSSIGNILPKRPGLHDEPTILAVTDHGLQDRIDRTNTNIIEYLYRPLDDERIRTRVSLLVELLHARRLLNFVDQKEPLDGTVTVLPRNEPADELIGTDDLKGRRVLLAEDNELNSFMVIHMLNGWGMEADAVSNGKEALEQLLTEPYDIILMDTHMPVMGGYDAIHLIRTSLHPPLNRIPIISLSASVFHEEQETAMRTGADDVVGKPFQPDILYYKMWNLLGRNKF